MDKCNQDASKLNWSQWHNLQHKTQSVQAGVLLPSKVCGPAHRKLVVDHIQCCRQTECGLLFCFCFSSQNTFSNHFKAFIFTHDDLLVLAVLLLCVKVLTQPGQSEVEQAEFGAGLCESPYIPASSHQTEKISGSALPLNDPSMLDGRVSLEWTGDLSSWCDPSFTLRQLGEAPANSQWPWVLDEWRLKMGGWIGCTHKRQKKTHFGGLISDVRVLFSITTNLNETVFYSTF